MDLNVGFALPYFLHLQLTRFVANRTIQPNATCFEIPPLRKSARFYRLTNTQTSALTPDT